MSLILPDDVIIVRTGVVIQLSSQGEQFSYKMFLCPMATLMYIV